MNFGMVSHSILLEKLIAHGVDRCTHHWVRAVLLAGSEHGGEWN